MNKTLQTIQWLLIAVIIVATIVILESSYRWWHEDKVNQYIMAPAKFEKVPNNPQAKLAQAALLVKENKTQQALDVLTRVIGSTDDQSIKADAYYNRGNINLRHAMTLAAKDNKRMPLVELAKQDYRTALNMQSDLWDARYNLNIALRLVPEEPNPNGAFKKESLGTEKVIKSKSFRVDLP